MNCTVRPALAEDIPALAAIDRLCESAPWTEEQLRAELTLGHARLFAAVCGGALCGFIDMHIAADDAHINELGVEPGARRRGIGGALVRAAEDRARLERCAVLSLEVRESNAAAAALYRKCGFRDVGRRRRFYTDPVEDGIIMLKELN
ncbi:MAG: ribosomal protein S18-alanine N-acetyltransferase [Oscillospiraceae bacterium]|nr:ribosomal protein S18-alanine N-acetyltransferase [Oscillospiraceae bacterium]